jgi:hypothetical protein
VCKAKGGWFGGGGGGEPGGGPGGKFVAARHGPCNRELSDKWDRIQEGCSALVHGPAKDFHARVCGMGPIMLRMVYNLFSFRIEISPLRTFNFFFVSGIKLKSTAQVIKQLHVAPQREGASNLNDWRSRTHRIAVHYAEKHNLCFF